MKSFAESIWEAIPTERRSWIDRDDVLLAVNHVILFERLRLLPIALVEGIAREVREKAGQDVGDDSWNPDAHISVTLTARECRAILDAAKLLPLECIRCHQPTGPVAEVDGDHAGWMCPKCMKELGGINNS